LPINSYVGLGINLYYVICKYILIMYKKNNLASKKKQNTILFDLMGKKQNQLLNWPCFGSQKDIPALDINSKN